MGGGTWTTRDFLNYANVSKKITDARGVVTNITSQQQNFKRYDIHPDMDIYGKTRECVDSEEHPNTVPVIIALDVTGSMGATAVEVANNLNPIMEDIFYKVKDVEFCVLAIGDFLFDDSPIQASQFESDIRIAENVDNIYFESGGGGNGSESYSAAWWFAMNCTKLDCHKRGKKGLIITIGDECLDRVLPKDRIKRFFGAEECSDYYAEKEIENVKKFFNVYHINIKGGYTRGVKNSWSAIGENFIESYVKELPDRITNIVLHHAESNDMTECSSVDVSTPGTEIKW